MVQKTSLQLDQEQVINLIGRYCVLETITWTVDANGELTNSSSSKSAITGIIQDLTAEDYPYIGAGYLEKGYKRLWVDNSVTLHAEKYRDGSDTKQDFIYYAGDGTSTPPSGAKRYEIIKVDFRGDTPDQTPNATSNANLIYTQAYLKLVYASG